MAKIPDATSIQRNVASGQRAVRGIDTRNFAPKELGAALSGLIDKNEKREYSKAEYELNSLKNKEDNSYGEDADYKTIPDRYSKNMSKGLGEISMSISNPSARAEFIQRNKLKIERGQETIKKVAFVKERDYERSYNTKALKELREQSITGDQEGVIASRETVKGLFDTGVEMGYYSQEEADNEVSNWRTSAAVGRLELMRPEERISFLKTDQAKQLPSDVRTKLTRQAEEATFAQKAVDTVDEYLLADMSKGDAMLAAGKIPDERLRKEVERRYDYMHKQQKEFESEAQFEASDDYAKKILNKELNTDGTPFTVDDIPKSDLDLLTANQQISLHKLQAATVGKSKTISNRDVIDKLYALKSRGKVTELRGYFMANRDKLNNSDHDTWSEVSNKGIATPEIESFFTDSKRFTDSVKGAKITDQDKINKLSSKFDLWYKSFQAVEGKKPTDTQVDAQRDRLLMEVPVDISFFDFDDETIPLFEATPQQLTDAVSEIRDDDPKVAKEVIEYFKSLNIDNPSNTDIIEAYNVLKEN